MLAYEDNVLKHGDEVSEKSRRNIAPRRPNPKKPNENNLPLLLALTLASAVCLFFASYPFVYKYIFYTQ